MTRRERLVLIASTIGFSMVLLDTTVVNVALGDIARDLHAGPTALEWVANGYTLVFAGLLLSTGLAADRIGARRVFLAGLAVFAAGSVAAALAPSAPALVGAQALLGVVGALSAAAVLAAALVARERTTARPLVPRELVADRRFTASTAGGALLNFAFYGELFFLSLFLQQERGLTALQTGLAFLPQPLLFMLISPLAGRLVAARGPRAPLMAGAALASAAAVALVAVDAHSGYAVMLVGLTLNGLGAGLAIPAVTAGVMGSAPTALAGIASAALNAGRPA